MGARIGIKRIYEAAQPEDGYRVLVDRVWPRGVSKADAALDAWMKDLAPSTKLRKWFGHDVARWEEFRAGYRRELADHPQALSQLLEKCVQQRVTLLYSARDPEHNQAVVLREVLEEELAEAWAPNEPASPVCYADTIWSGGN